MKTFRFLTLLTLGLLIFGSAGYFGYELFVKPSRMEKRAKSLEAGVPAPTATPDPGLPEFQRLKALQSSGQLAPARDGWNAWIVTNKQSPLLPEALNLLGAANMALMFQSSGNPSTTSYTVVKGDSLAKIAAKHHSNAELIQRANQLPNINLQIGEQLIIPAPKISLEIDRAKKTLTLLDNGSFMKAYPLLSSPRPPKTSANVTSKVIDKLATAGSKRVAFGDKSYSQSERVILLAQSPAIVGFKPAPTTPPAAVTPPSTNTPVAVNTGTNNSIASTSPQATSQSTPLPYPSGYVLTSEDILEIFPLVSRNTVVVIH